ncbi:hypothetical protein GP486_008974 [Trichoglossum hirsutum]|uniref:Uncharacterized protein n=1 Tax=Trichoglossum hirsutum TaxID=265104 RepID=A0A9P8I119_9PEZI|nr:hypothetical protein GP486_008974 [Trichoglossum hirsutum]
MPLERYFVPASASRSLRPTERGYWRICVIAWDLEIRDRFWSFLEDFVGQGRAGWGVWVSRYAEKGGKGGDESPAENAGAVSEPMNRDFQFGELIKIYCWGGIVGYMWLALVIASDRCIKGSESCWVDGGEKVVIRMS